MSSKSLEEALSHRMFDKYDYYIRAVQQPDEDVKFFRDTYRELAGRTPHTLREDFCGTFALCCAWAKLGEKYVAHGLDLDEEPIEYGREKYLAKLTREQQKRVTIHNLNVMDPRAPKADLINALNFSYFIFKKRLEMKRYLTCCLDSLNPDGLLILDCFGGSECQSAIEDATKHSGFTYYWDQVDFDPVTHHARFHIHFKPEGRKKIKRVFTYDWRMWTIPELRDLMEEVGFSESFVYWEGTDEATGQGNSEFTRVETGEECESWIAYVVGKK
ncbi:MAG: hypothetical protein AUJ52_07645 [Elusimicrobia bacterium CG1_02_63_36]|nr:MAG: hypothetical protein AUJ52_07645 [Elusimicrobia bacterium CG1_02_63_36]